MMKWTLAVAALVALSACSSESSAPATDNAAQAAAPANQAAPAAASGAYDGMVSDASVSTSAMRAAFQKHCPMSKFVQNATCEAGAKPGEYNCKYVLTGEDALGEKPIKLVGSGDSWDFVEIPPATDCKQ